MNDLTRSRSSANSQPLEHGHDVHADGLLRRGLMVHRHSHRVRSDGDLGVVPPASSHQSKWQKTILLIYHHYSLPFATSTFFTGVGRRRRRVRLDHDLVFLVDELGRYLCQQSEQKLLASTNPQAGMHPPVLGSDSETGPSGLRWCAPRCRP